MILNLFDMLFGCWHKNYSFPITARAEKRRTPAASVTGTYVVCLDCGKEFAYDWKAMKLVSSAPAKEIPQTISTEPIRSWQKVA